MTSNPPKPSMGVLGLRENSAKFSLTRHVPAPELSPFVKHYWIIQWDLTGRPAHNQDVVPNPCVNLVVQSGQTAFYGVPKGVHSHRLEGKGTVFGIKFKPGGFFPFVKKPLSVLAGKSIGTLEVLGIKPAEIEKAILSKHTPEEMMALAEEMLLSRLPSPDDTVTFINEIIEYVQTNRQVTTVDQMCSFAGLNKRALQRLFSQYVGVRPKWIIQLSRLQNAAEMMDYGTYEDGMKLAMELGYYDQSHFIKDFKSVIGKTPEEYMRLKSKASQPFHEINVGRPTSASP